MRLSTHAFLALGFVATACTHYAAPPQAPAREVPADVEARTSPTPPNHTRVLLEANGEPAVVNEVTATALGSGEVSGYRGTVEVKTKDERLLPVCLAPCLVDLTPGMHVLRFQSSRDARSSDLNVQVGDREKAIRYAIGRNETGSTAYNLSGLLLAAGATGALLGGVLAAVEASSAKDDSSLSSGHLQNAGVAMLAAGIGAVIVSLPLMILTRPVVQPGTATELPLPPSGALAHASP